MRIFTCARVEIWDYFKKRVLQHVPEHLLIFSQVIDAGFWRKGKLTAALRRTFCSFYKRVLARAERMTLFALIFKVENILSMILWSEVIITRENSFTKGQWNKGKKALFSMILIFFFFSLSFLCLPLILCPLWISFDHGSWDWSWFAGVPILAYRICPACNHELTSQMVEIYNSTRLRLDNCEIFLYREVKLTENEMLTIDCV